MSDSERLAELEALFDLRWEADQRAITRWQEAHPGNDLVWPDRADMVVWLLDEDARLRAAIKDHVEVGCITGHTGGNLARIVAER